jgi:hypothetical protein
MTIVPRDRVPAFSKAQKRENSSRGEKLPLD